MKRKICEGRISSTFGTRRDPMMPTTWRIHNGIDIATPIGTPVFAPFDCVVVATYRHRVGGNTIIIRDMEGVMRVGFCHLHSYCVQVDDKILKGERLANTGNSGSSTGPHLHLSLKTGGKWNPYKDYIGGQWADPTAILEFECE